MDLSDTTVGGRYRLGATIGTGGMSDVYAATDELLGRDVAVKMMRADLARDTTFLERFRREAQNAAKLNHHAIVAVYDTGQTDPEHGSVPYIVMERVHGETLRDIVRESGPMPLDEASRVMAQVCQALQFSHEAGIIHRDIKPANIMITNTGAVKVMDFGIARALSDSSSAMTQTAAVIGTAQYLSPEQARGKSADARSDLYAAGCVFYELVTGRPPFEGESPFSVAFQHVQDDPVLPSHVPGMQLDQRRALALDSVVLTAMSKDPADRYYSAADMAADLTRLADGQMPLAAATHSDDPATTVMPGTPGYAGGAGAGAGAAAGAAGRAGYAAGHAAGHPAGVRPGEGYDAARAPQHAPAPGGVPAEPRHVAPADGPGPARRRRRPWVAALWTVVVLALVGVVGLVGWNQFGGDDGDGRQASAPAQQVAVPDVANLARDDARARLRDAGFDVRETEQPHATVVRDHAIGTEPAARSSLPKGAAVTLVLSSGKEITEVPDLTGRTTEVARNLLSDAGLTLKSSVRERPSDSVPAGQIIEQSPAQGSQVSKGTEVGITVSTGPQQVRVPQVTGQQLDVARQNLESAGFVVEVDMVDSLETENLVLSTSSEGAQQPKGSTVTLEVSRGNQFRMPDLTGTRYSDVAAALQRAGWRASPDQLTRHDVKTPDISRVDQVTQQSVPAGQAVSRDTRVDVGVNVFSLLP